jgi:hypothetical protein
MQKTDPNYGVGINPISRLIQVQQAEQKKEPVFTLITERSLLRRREFVMQVTSLFGFMQQDEDFGIGKKNQFYLSIYK